MIGSALLAVTGMAYGAGTWWAVAAFYEPWRQRWAYWLAWIGWLAETGWLVWSAYMLGGTALFTLDRWLGLLEWLSLAVFFVFASRRSWETVLGFLLPVIFLLWAVGILTASARSRPDVLGALLVLHIVLAALAYVALLLSALVATMYTEKERELRRKHVRLFYYRLPALEAMDGLSASLITAGVALLTAAVGTGAVWEKEVSGRYWTWSAKETWTLVTWLAYSLYLIARWRWGWRGHRAAVWSMAAFLLVVVNLFAINALFPGFHALVF